MYTISCHNKLVCTLRMRKNHSSWGNEWIGALLKKFNVTTFWTWKTQFSPIFSTTSPDERIQGNNRIRLGQIALLARLYKSLPYWPYKSKRKERNKKEDQQLRAVTLNKSSSKLKGCRMGRSDMSDKVSLWYVALLINTRFRFFILE